jgi:excinuclease UvrABC nuclease subunit
MRYDLSVPLTVYLHHAHDGSVLYVGCTSNLEQRTADHRRRARWRKSIARVEIDGIYIGYDAGVSRERELIGQHQPPYNIQGNPSPFFEGSAA